MMIRLVLVLTLLFTLPILVIRAQTYEDQSLRALLTPPDNCERPCFMGLRPAITTQEETIQRFHAAEHIRYAVRMLDSQRSIIYWRDTQSPYSGSVHFENHLATDFTIQGFRLQDVWLLLGEPDQGTMFYENYYLERDSYFRFPRTYEGEYSDYGFTITFNLSCDLFWYQLVTVTVSSDPLASAAQPESLPARRRETCISERSYRRAVSKPTAP